jgi:cell division septation protein DedD
VVGVIAAVAVPYVIDYLNPPAKPVASKAPSSPAPAPAPGATPPGGPAATAPAKPAQPGATTTPAQPGAPATAAPGKPGTKSPTTSGQAPAIAAKPEAKPAEPSAPKVAAKSSETAGGTYWVQVGAFRDPEHAARLAATLRQQNFTVTESADKAATRPADVAAASATSVDRYDVYVVDATPATLSAKLSAKGLRAESATDGAVVRPSLVLRDAVSLSKELAVDGLKVQVKRARATEGDSAPRPAPGAATPSASAGEVRPLHRVRVGPFPDRAAAQAALKELEAKGYKPFIARGR